ncbi:TetR/AcrR family transcriptional regulator [Amycolatopsis sp. NPDC058986]|uniref:TetR/AcrR family transcriptional regulator n=1 Tax=unclassified Amycolatopsis TaxID=2618356 RepID=UPI00367270CC
MAGRDTYHHGDLRNALLDATTELVRERGAKGFSVSEAARRAGVSPSAPYRHFADRDAMLAATAQHAFTELEARFTALALEPTLTGRAAQIAVAYVAFAREDPARFEVMFAAGIDKTAHPELLDQTRRVQTQLAEALSPHVPPAELVDRAAELWSIAHGVAALTVGGNLRHVVDPPRIDTIAASAARAWATGTPGPGR